MLNKNLNISVVTPVYGCGNLIVELYFRLRKSLGEISDNYEIIFVNDASADDAWSIIKDIADKDFNVKGINFSRNFGQHYAISAGLEASSGDWVIVLDCDLQDQPEEIVKLYNKAQEGYDIVLGRRLFRQDSFFKKITSKIFYKLLKYFTETEQDSSIANFGIYNRNVIEAVCSMQDNIRFFPAMIKWVGFNSTTIIINHGKRLSGKTTYSFKKMFTLGLNIIMSFSDKPLKVVAKLGIIISLLSAVFGVYNLIQYLTGSIMVSGWTSLIISIWFFSGLIIFVLGLLGLYIGKIFDKVKERPHYIVKDKINLNE